MRQEPFSVAEGKTKLNVAVVIVVIGLNLLFKLCDWLQLSCGSISICHYEKEEEDGQLLVLIELVGRVKV